MGNESSSEMDEGSGMVLQTQGEQQDLWTLRLQRGPGGEGEGVCVFTRKPGKGAQAELCMTAVEHLRLLRHPNIVKYLDSEDTPEQILLITEPLIPVLRSLEGATTIDSIVMGWRGLGAGLDFLHQKARLSHNNLNVSCVYINVLDSQWKLGGLEAASAHKCINKAFLASISAIRHEKAIPPEDKEKVGTVVSAPIHARDVWGFGHLIVAIVEEVGLEALLPESSFQYISDDMLNWDPQLRPAVSEVLSQPWMSNKSSFIADFLSNLTLKTKSEKDRFFHDLASDLHYLSPQVVAEHVVPVLITSLVMAEPVAQESLWQHLLLPVTTANPRRKAFDSSHPCPLLEQDLFKSHVLPLVLNLLESRDYHVRLTLLAHLGGYASLCDHEDLVGVVLPEVLVGLKDTSDELVGATLHALGELVPLLGADVVMGTNRKQLFTDAQPRAQDLKVTESQKPANSRSNGLPPARKNTPPLSRSKSERSREDRMREMKEKREQQKMKRMSRSKLGEAVGNPGTLNFTESEIEAPPADSSPQYSPSISHDEVEYEGAGGSSTSIEVTGQRSEVTGEGSDEPGEDEEEDWGESWSDIEDTKEQLQEEPVLPVAKKSQSSRNSSSKKLLLKSPQNSREEKGKSNLSQSATIEKGRLGSEDIKRLEEQSAWAKEELDLFADMAPKISPSGALNGSGFSSTGTTPIKTMPPSALQYQPEQAETTSGDWDIEEWNDNF